MQVAPIDELKDLIKHFIIYKPKKNHQPLRFFTDGNPGLVVPMENYLLPFLDKPMIAKGEILVYGLIDHFIDIPPPPPMGLIIVVLQPYGLSTLSDLSSSLFKNQIFRLDKLLGSTIPQSLCNIRDLESPSDIITMLEQHLMTIIDARRPIDPIIKTSVSLMHDHFGMITNSELLARLPISERNLERKFERYIGFSPKKLSGIIRVNHFLKLIRNPLNPLPPLSAAIAAGFYDQAHLNNYFKSLTGASPLQYLRHSDPLAQNLFGRQ